MKNVIYLSAALFAAAGASVPAWAVSDNATISITAIVNASCTLVAPSVVPLGEIQASDIAGKSVGDDLTDYTKTFNLSAECFGTDRYTYTFVPSTVDGQCIGTDKESLRFCLKAGDTQLDMGAGSASWPGQDEITTITVTPQVGTQPAVAGEVSGTVTVMIEPV